MVLRLVTFLVVGAMTVVLARKVMEQLEASKTRAKVQAKRSESEVTRLRRDPVTGIYRPEA